MIKKIDITNGYGETLSLDLFQPELSGFAIREITGLGPVEATVSMADYASKPGGKFQGSRLGTREITFDLVFLDTKVSIETVRHQSYKYFPIGEKITIDIYTDERKVTTTGYVSTNEPYIWDSEMEGTSISVICESPYLSGKDLTIKTLASTYSTFHFPFSSVETPPELLFGYVKIGEDLEITNDGEAEVGCVFTISALEDFSNPLIYNDYDGTYFGLIINLDEGDQLVINTKIGEKSAKLIRNGQEYNVINYMKSGSTWFMLKRGKNKFSIAQAGTYTKTLAENSNGELMINADRKDYTINEVRLTMPLIQKNANKASSTKPKEVKTPTGFHMKCTNKTFWADSETDRKKYDVDSKSAEFSYAIKTLFKYIIDEDGNPSSNRAPLAFGAGYLTITYDHENEEDNSEEEKQMGQPKLVMTHVKIPYYTSDKKIDPSWTFSNTYNKGVKYTYAKMKLSSCSFTYSSSQTTDAVFSKTITLDRSMPETAYKNESEWRVRPCYNYNLDDFGNSYYFSIDDQFEVTVGGETWNRGNNDHCFDIAVSDNAQHGMMLFFSSNGMASGTQIKIKITKSNGVSLSSRLIINNSKLKKNSTIYSNRFVYHPEFNTAATVKELSYYFPDMAKESQCVSYWDNKGRLVLVEFKKGNYTNVKAKIKKLKNGKKKVIKKAIKKAKYSPGYKHWKYSTAKTWLKNNPTYVIVELKKPIEYIIDERMGMSDANDSSKLQQMMYDILNNYPEAIDNKIYLKALPYKNDSTSLRASLQASFTKSVPGRYEYYNDSPASTLIFNNCYPMSALWMRIAVPYSSTAYRAVAIKLNEDIDDEYNGPIVIDIGTSNNFYGGYIDVTNGTVIYTYDSSGDLSYTETGDSEPASGKTYYTKSGDDYIEFTGTEFEHGVPYYEMNETENPDIIDDVEIEFREGTNKLSVYGIIGAVSYVATQDLSPIEGKNYYTKNNSVYTLYEGDDFEYEATSDLTPQSGKTYYLDTDDGYVIFEGSTFESGVTYYERAKTYYEESDTTGPATIDRLIYPVPDGTILDRMNLKIEHDNLYVGI